MSVVNHRRVTQPQMVVGARLTSDDMRAMREIVINAWRTAGGGALAVDMSRVDEMDARGVMMLITCRRLAAVGGVELVLQAPSSVVTDLLDQLRLSNAFRIVAATCS